MTLVVDSTMINRLKERMSDLETKLKMAKCKLDGIPHVSFITRNLDPYRREKYKIARTIEQKHITNAWLKCFSIIKNFDLLTGKEAIRHFDNASLPGSFILCARYIVETYHPNTTYDWMASSLYDKDAIYLGDSYDLMKRYPEHWTMDEENNGDITDINVIDAITKKIELANFKPNLYTSDLGFDVSNDYNGQEVLHFAANTGQILTCLRILADGGICIIKHFTCFEEYTLQYLQLFSRLFKKFIIHKPKTSKSLNSEVYLIGAGFMRKNAEIQVNELIGHLSKCLETRRFAFEDTEKYPYPARFVQQILVSMEKRIHVQISQLYIVVEIAAKIERIASASNIKLEAADMQWLWENAWPIIRKYVPRVNIAYSKINGKRALLYTDNSKRNGYFIPNDI